MQATLELSRRLYREVSSLATRPWQEYHWSVFALTTITSVGCIVLLTKNRESNKGHAGSKPIEWGYWTSFVVLATIGTTAALMGFSLALEKPD